MNRDEKNKQLKQELYIDTSKIGEAYKKIMQTMPLEPSQYRNKVLYDLKNFPKKMSFFERTMSRVCKWFEPQGKL
ncbi:hypothetical protein NEAUS03_2191 [Nematocida ausubeli]|nr:hypothetical protein NEAUS03_2191 [Nematocida ausubeli]